MKTQLALLVIAFSLFAAGSVQAYDPEGDVSQPGEIASPGQPFAHPADDRSYSRDLQEDKSRVQAAPAGNGALQYISGGVGDDDLNAINTEQGAYNLKLIFAAGGAYLANVGVEIMDSKGQNLLDIRTEGPVLLVKIPHGTYTVKATTEAGETLSQRIKVGKDHLDSYVLHYPTIEK